MGTSVRSLALLFTLLVPQVASGVDTPPDSISQTSPASIHILLDNGEVLQVQRVWVGALGLIHLRGADGKESSISANRVRTITDEQGRDRTKEVLVGDREIHVGGPGPPEKPKPPPPGLRGRLLSAHAGLLSPIGSFQDASEPGFTLNGSLEWRTSLHETYGVRIEFSEFGGDQEVETFLSTNTGGEVQQLRYRFWGVSGTTRYLIRPDHRLVPFLQASLGIQAFTTSLTGPAAEGSNTVFALMQDIGLGVNVRFARALSGELVAAYTRVTTGKSTTTATAASVSSDGTLQYLQFKAGLVRRLGGSP